MKSLLNWIINHLLLSGTLFFAAGTVALPGTESEPTSTEGIASEETTEESTEGTEEAEETEEVEGGTEGTEGTKPPVEAKVDWSKIPQEVKSHIHEITKTNAKLGNMLQNAVYTSQTFLREFPKGLKEAQELKRSVSEIEGGLEGARQAIATHRSLVDEQEALDGQARSGDPAVLDNLVEIAGEGFNKLMPRALDMWAAKDEAGYSHVISKVLVQSLQDGNVVNDLNIASQMLSLGTPESIKIAIESFKRASDFINKIGQIAAKVPEKPKVDPEVERGNRELESGRVKLFNDQFASQFGPWRENRIKDILRTVAPKDRKFTKDQLDALGGRVVREASEILTADPDYMKNLQRIHNTRNQAELQKFTRARTERLLLGDLKTPGLVKKAYRVLFTDSTLGTKKKVIAKKPGEVVVDDKNKGKEVKGWIKISADKAPKPTEINNTLTDFDMKYRKQAILLNGKKVFWGEKVPV